MIKSLAVFLLVMSLTVQQCDRGCLKCNTKNECVFCDNTNGFFLSLGKCSQSTLANCSWLAQNGDCLRCAANFYLDFSTKKCVAVETAKLIANCSFYSSIQACTLCAKGYFIKDGKCVAVTKTVDNCENYKDDGKCENCASGFLFNATRDACIASPNISGCGSYTFLECKACSFGYISNDNLYFNAWQLTSTPIYDAIWRSFIGIRDWMPTSRCQKIEDPNCKVASSAKVCATCNDGFFLTASKTCRAYPKPIIKYCLTYNSLTTCSGCLPGYFLETAVKCTLIAGDKLIPDCANYDNTASNVVCTSCSSSRFLNANTCTSLRVNSLNIANCKAVTVNADTCKTCNDGFILRSDSLRCLAVVPNCLLHNDSAADATLLTCKSCKNGFYLNTDTNGLTSCLAGAINGCQVYASKDVCTTCDNLGFYLSASICVAHPKVENCVNYAATSYGDCATCAVGFYPFKLSETCERVETLIANCITYNKNDSKCTACATGFFLKNDNTCVAYSTLPGCKDANTSGVCIECLEGYAKKSDNTCELNYNHITDMCAQLSANAVFQARGTAENTQCQVCKENTYPVVLNNQSVCVRQSLFAVRYPEASNSAANCAKFSFQSTAPNDLVCIECKPGYYLKADGTPGGEMFNAVCALSPPDETSYTCGELSSFSNQSNICFKHSTTDTTTYFKMNLCAKSIMGSNLSTSCLKLSPGQAATTKLIIDAIDASSTNDYSEEIEASTVPKVVNDFLYQGYRTKVSETGTEAHSTAAIGADVGVVGADQLACELYNLAGGNYLCWRCRWGFTVKYTTATATSCLKLACNTAIRYGGFSSKLNQLLSCHTCTDSTKVLTLSIVSYVAAPDLTIEGQVTNEDTLRCLTPLTGALDTHTATQPKKIDNCLLYGLIYDDIATGTFDATRSGCLACAPGYAPTTLTDQVTQTCSKITGCDVSKNFYVNRCYDCTQVNASGAVEFKAFGDIELQTCKVTNTANCLITSATQNTDNTFQCSTCRPGYILNKDLRCERITLPNCSDSSVTFFLETVSNKDTYRRYFMLFKLNQRKRIRGCNDCNSGFLSSRVITGERQCVGSSYVTGNSYPTGTKYIPDCARFKNDLDFSGSLNARCDLCKTGKVVTLDGTKCVSTTDKLCKVAKNIADGTCYTCVDTHVAINGVCVTKSITDCATYDTTETVSELLCTACKNGFVLAPNKKSCTAGYVFGCNVYPDNQPWQCTTCKDGFVKINTSNTRNYCFRINDSSNCSALDNDASNGLQNRLYKCSACKSTNSAGFIPKSWPNTDSSKLQSICLALNPVDNCEDYDSASLTVGSNSYLCTKCKTGFYLDESKNQCVARINLSTACTEYEVKTDRCKVCGPNTFISVDAKDCIAFPNGIFSCATYSNDTVCTSCNPPYYLVNNTCELSTVITNCVAYSSNFTCTNCDSGYFLTNSTFCELAKAVGCQTYTSISACASCDPKNTNKGLKTDNGATSCVDKNVANCEISTNEFPFKCIQCKKDFYPVADGSCQVATAIDKCLIYDTANSCTLCDKAAVLSPDRKSCNATFFAGSVDLNCDSTYQLSTPICSTCNPGQIFANGTCTSCLEKTFVTGCFSCNPNNQSECFACKPGFYQTLYGACITTAPQEIANNTNSSTMIFSFLGLLSVLIGLIF